MSEQKPLDAIPAPGSARFGVPAARLGAAPSGGRSRRAAGTALLVLFLGLALFVAVVAWDDARAHSAAAQEASRATGLATQLNEARQEDAQLSQQVATLRSDNTKLQDAAKSPTLPMWNSCGGPCSVGPSSVRVGSVPDTFQLQLDFTADVPIHAYVFTFHQWTEFDSCGFSLRCVTGSYQTFPAATTMSQTFDDAEGCSGYVWVLQADRDGTIQPNVQVRYVPAAQPTGVCAASP